MRAFLLSFSLALTLGVLGGSLSGEDLSSWQFLTGQARAQTVINPYRFDGGGADDAELYHDPDNDFGAASLTAGGWTVDSGSSITDLTKLGVDDTSRPNPADTESRIVKVHGVTLPNEYRVSLYFYQTGHKRYVQSPIIGLCDSTSEDGFGAGLAMSDSSTHWLRVIETSDYFDSRTERDSTDVTQSAFENKWNIIAFEWDNSVGSYGEITAQLWTDVGDGEPNAEDLGAADYEASYELTSAHPGTDEFCIRYAYRTGAEQVVSYIKSPRIYDLTE